MLVYQRVSFGRWPSAPFATPAASPSKAAQRSHQPELDDGTTFSSFQIPCGKNGGGGFLKRGYPQIKSLDLFSIETHGDLGILPHI